MKTPPPDKLTIETRCDASWQIVQHQNGFTTRCRRCGVYVTNGGTPKCLRMNIEKEVNKDILLQIGFKKIKGVAWAADASAINRGYELRIGDLKSVSIFSPDDVLFYFENSYISMPIKSRKDLLHYLFDHLTSYLSSAQQFFQERPDANINQFEPTKQLRTR